MPRLFVAINLPDGVKDRLIGLRTDIPTARWVRPEQMHLTLRFIGDTILANKVEAIDEAMMSITAAAFDLALYGVGRFPPGHRKPPRVLWVGIAPQPDLNRLQHAVEQALESVGFEPDSRPFSAHITLARLKSYGLLPEVADFLHAHVDFAVDPFRVSEFRLYESELTPRGPRYVVRGRYILRDG
jgi:RNA 2',3'-cyclic 3'-phosphodiesterase